MTTLCPLDPELLNIADADPERRLMVSRMAAATGLRPAPLSLDEARRLRDMKITQALDHAERESVRWGDMALDYLKRYAETNDVFPGWFVTRAADLTGAVPTPPTLKAWGSIFTKAARSGWIQKCGYRQDPHRHANPCPVWKSLIYQGREAA